MLRTPKRTVLESDCCTTGVSMEAKEGTAFKAIPTDGCYRRVRRERMLGAISGERLTQPGLAGFPTCSTLHPGTLGCDADHRPDPGSRVE